MKMAILQLQKNLKSIGIPERFLILQIFILSLIIVLVVF